MNLNADKTTQLVMRALRVEYPADPLPKMPDGLSQEIADRVNSTPKSVASYATSRRRLASRAGQHLLSVYKSTGDWNMAWTDATARYPGMLAPSRSNEYKVVAMADPVFSRGLITTNVRMSFMNLNTDKKTQIVMRALRVEYPADPLPKMPDGRSQEIADRVNTTGKYVASCASARRKLASQAGQHLLSVYKSTGDWNMAWADAMSRYRGMLAPSKINDYKVIARADPVFGRGLPS